MSTIAASTHEWRNCLVCIAIPMQVIKTGNGLALCEGMDIQREVETLLVGDQPVGTWLLVFLASAREVITEQDAKKISNAIQAVDLVMAGGISAGRLPDDAINALFSDLIDREPPKPASLLALEQERTKK